MSQAPGSVPGTASTPAPATVAGTVGDPRTWYKAVEMSKREIPEGLWMRCPACGAMLYKKNVEQNKQVCPECQHHFRIGPMNA